MYRENSHGNKAKSHPCAACLAALAKCGIGEIYFTTNDGFCHEQIDVQQIKERIQHLPYPI